jgi:CRISPR system Cascade subunit CasE
MFITKIELDNAKRISPSKIHGALESSFSYSKSEKRNLWRIDGDLLIILTVLTTNFAKIVEQFGNGKPYKTLNYSHFIDSIRADTLYNFVLTVNAVQSSSLEFDKSGRGKIISVPDENLKLWLIKKAEVFGFKLDDSEFSVVDSSFEEFYKKGKAQTVKIKTSRFKGKLKVVDLERFKLTLTEGIGKEKAYGCGLLTIEEE